MFSALSLRSFKPLLGYGLATWMAVLLFATSGPLDFIPRASAADAPTVLITGSNRGLGFGFARQYAKKGWNVIATCRKPEDATDLQELAASYPNVVIERMDVTDHAGVDALAAKYEGTPIDVVINNAAITGNVEHRHIDELDYDTFSNVIAVNMFGPLKVTAAFADHVAASDQKKIMTVTTGLGSLAIAGNMKGFPYYRISKAALNMAMRAANADLRDRGITVGLISPGMVNTKMLEESGYKGPSLTPDESAAALIELIDGYTQEMTQAIINVDNKKIPW